MKRIGMHLAIVIILLLIGSCMSLIFYREVHYTAIQVYEHRNIENEGPLLKNSTIRGEVTSVYDNFGTVKIRVNTFGRFNYDTIHFRLREKGTQEWIVKNSYAVDTFRNKLLYGFGFPIFRNSAGKTYEFELTSDTGTPDNSIGFYTGKYSLATQYVFSKNTLMNNPEKMPVFLKTKIVSLISDPFVLLYYAIFLLPAVLYSCLFLCKNAIHLYAIEFFSFLYMLIAYMFIPIAISWDTILFIVFSAVFIFEAQSYFVITNKNHVSRGSFIASHMYHLPMLLIGIMLWNVAIKNDLVANRAAIGVFYLTVLSLILSYKEVLYNK